MNSDRVFLIFRRFDRLSVRNLLCLQAEICNIEQRIAELDQQDMNTGASEDLLNLHSWLEDKNEERKRLLLSVREKLDVYRMQS
jgi:hypothetical protein